jgi:hypothetical protein
MRAPAYEHNSFNFVSQQACEGYEVGLRPFYKGNFRDIQKCILKDGLGLSTILFSVFQRFSQKTAAATTR